MNVALHVLSVVFVGFCAATFNAHVLAPRDTTVNIYKLPSPQPLLLKSAAFKGNNRYYWPKNRDGDLVFKEGDIVTLACPGRNLMIGSKNTNVESAEAVHHNGKFAILNQNVVLTTIKCSAHSFHTARYTGKSCLGSYKEAEIGFELDNEFISHIKLCFDTRLQNTLYAEFNMTRFINGYQRDVERPDFIQDDFYNVGSVNSLYTRKTQRKTINSALGLSSGDYKYVSQNNDLFLTRGHLSAKVDFVYEAQQRFTFHYINVAPQWQSFNGGNWNTLEQDVRTFVAKQNTDITIYTGTHGIATLPHEHTSKEVELYLYTSNGKALPVPRLFWKVLYKPSEKSGIAFVGVNNPYYLEEKQDVICKDICDQVSWLHWDARNMTGGYSYCCDVNDLRSTVKNLPEFTVSSILH